jgi:hypothetical protein
VRRPLERSVAHTDECLQTRPLLSASSAAALTTWGRWRCTSPQGRTPAPSAPCPRGWGCRLPPAAREGGLMLSRLDPAGCEPRSPKAGCSNRNPAKPSCSAEPEPLRAPPWAACAPSGAGPVAGGHGCRRARRARAACSPTPHRTSRSRSPPHRCLGEEQGQGRFRRVSQGVAVASAMGAGSASGSTAGCSELEQAPAAPRPLGALAHLHTCWLSSRAS